MLRFLFLMVALGGGVAAVKAQPPKSEEQLDPQTRQQLDELRSKVRQAEVELEQARQRAYAENPLLPKAIERLKYARNLEERAGSKHGEVQRFLAGKGPDAQQQLRNWEGRWGEVLDYEHVQQMLDDPQQRPYVAWLAKLLFEDLAKRDPSTTPGYRDLVKDLQLPKDGQLSPQRAMEIYLLLLKRNRDLNLAKAQELERSLDPPEIVRQYVRERHKSHAMFFLYDTYVRVMTPAYVTEAEKKLKQLQIEISRVRPAWGLAEEQSRQASTPTASTVVVPGTSYEETLKDLHAVLGQRYPCFELKGIDWQAVGRELLPRAKAVKTDAEFGLLCLELVARLEDSHAQLNPAKAQVPEPPLPRWDPGLACLIDDREELLVYYVDPEGPADKAGVRVGMTLKTLQGQPAKAVLAAQMNLYSRYVGYSSDRYLCYDASRFIARQMEQNTTVALEMQDVDGKTHHFNVPATMAVRYLPRLPVPIPGIRDSANVSWTMLDGKIGYIYVRRIREDLIEKLNWAVDELKDAKGMIVDVRGNSGGGFDSQRSHRNFALDDAAEPDRPRFRGPMALLIDARTVSAGEGWASWFVAKKRAILFGEATAGASSRKETYTLKNGLYTVTFPVKAYTGYLDRPIERRGLEPDVTVRQNARELAAGRDTVLEAARKFLMVP